MSNIDNFAYRLALEVAEKQDMAIKNAVIRYFAKKGQILTTDEDVMKAMKEHNAVLIDNLKHESLSFSATIKVYEEDGKLNIEMEEKRR